MRKFSLTIPIKPEPKQRPGFSRKRKKAYTPKKTKDYEEKISDYFLSHVKVERFDKDVPLVVNLIFGMPIPKSTSKKRVKVMLEGAIKPTKKPDIDNMQKAVLDAMPAVEETQFVRHVRFDKPLKIMMDGKKQHGVVLLPSANP